VTALLSRQLTRVVTAPDPSRSNTQKPRTPCRMMGIGERTLYRKIKSYQLE